MLKDRFYMSAAENKVIAMRWMSYFNAHDLEGLLSLYHDKAEHYSPKLKIHEPSTMGLIRGKDSLRAWWQDAFTRLPSLKYELTKLTAGDDSVFMEYTRKVHGEEDMMVAEILGISDGVIVFSRVYHG
jgi:hypothetical protein